MPNHNNSSLEMKKPLKLLFGNSLPASNNDNVTTVELSRIKLPASQPRRYFDQGKLEELAQSIKELGLIAPLLVRPLPDGDYELVAGERRYRAAAIAQLKKAQIISKEMDDATAYQIRLVENIQREGLNPLEETEGILELLAVRLELDTSSVVQLLYRMDNEVKGKATHKVMGSPESVVIEEVFVGLGRMKWRSFVVNYLPLLKLPQDILSALRSGKIEYKLAKAIAKIADKEIRDELLADAIKANLTLEEIKARISAIKSASQKPEDPLNERINKVFGQLKKPQLWQDSKNKAKVEKLLSQLEEILGNDKK